MSKLALLELRCVAILSSIGFSFKVVETKDGFKVWNNGMLLHVEYLREWVEMNLEVGALIPSVLYENITVMGGSGGKERGLESWRIPYLTMPRCTCRNPKIRKQCPLKSGMACAERKK